jgi:hypothetical protein
MRVGGQAADEEEEEEHAQEAMWPSQVVLVAGGTGVLPLLQLARWLLLDAISPQERPRSGGCCRVTIPQLTHFACQS